MMITFGMSRFFLSPDLEASPLRRSGGFEPSPDHLPRVLERRWDLFQLPHKDMREFALDGFVPVYHALVRLYPTCNIALGCDTGQSRICAAPGPTFFDKPCPRTPEQPNQAEANQAEVEGVYLLCCEDLNLFKRLDKVFLKLLAYI